MAGQDWYSVLQVAPDATTDEIAQAVEKRSRQAAALANTSPERSQQLREQVRAIKRDLLSGDEARARYDGSRPAAPAPPSTEPQPDALARSWPAAVEPGHQQTTAQPGWEGHAAAAPRKSRFRQFMQSGWTCWHCGESAMPADRYCTQCQAQLTHDLSWTPVTVPVTNANMCPYCGTTAALTHRFCRNCGAARPV